MCDITILAKDFSYVQVEADYNIICEMRDYFAFEVPGYKFHPKYRTGFWDGKIRLMEIDGRLPIGLVSIAKQFASNMDYEISIDPRLDVKPQLTREQFDSWVAGLDIYAGNTKIDPHWYQGDSVFHGINSRRSVLNLPTSAGKSLIQALISRWFLENYESKVLVIVPTTSLVNQMQDDFVDYRLFPRSAIGLMGGGKKNYCSDDSMIVVSTWQTAVKQSAEWFKQFGALMVDECFDGDTAIMTPIGPRPIKELSSGDAIYSYDEETGEIVEDVVVKRHENLTKSSSEKMYEMEMDDGTIIHVTGNHQFMTGNRGWVRADELTSDDEIIEWK